MLDVHHAQQPCHTWRDFLIHIATIVVGLFIALGLEQSVEVLHRHHERKELLAALNLESAQIIHDASTSKTLLKSLMSWSQANAQQVKLDIQQHKPYVNPSGVTLQAAASPDDPIYKAAKASGKLTLLSDQEIAAYSELDRLIVLHRQATGRTGETSSESYRGLQLYRSTDNPEIYVPIPLDELRKLYVALEADSEAYRSGLINDFAIGSVAAQLLNGERGLDQVQRAEISSMPGTFMYH